jgi:serine/threonine protein kinase
MELVDGSTLEDVLQQRGALPLPVALAIAVGILEALHYAHTLNYTLYSQPHRGVMHRDIKPSNVIFSGGIPKLTDFGIARPVTVSLHTLQGSVVGTVPYMAPETCTSGESDFRSDIYQVGLLMYECISGKMAYPQTDLTPLVEAIKIGERKPLDTHPKAAAIVKRCLELDPNKRYQSAQECLADVRALYHVQSPKILPDVQISAYLSGTTPTEEKHIRTGGRVGERQILRGLKIAAVAIPCALLALLLVVFGFKYGTNVLQAIIQATAAPETAAETSPEQPPPSAPEPPQPAPAPAQAPRPKPATPAASVPTKQAPAKAAQEAKPVQEAQTPPPEDALNLINEGKVLLAQHKPQEALAKFQRALEIPSASMTRQEIIKRSLYGSAQCNSILYQEGKIPRASYEASWRSVQNTYPAGSHEHAESIKRLDNGAEK